VVAVKFKIQQSQQLPKLPKRRNKQGSLFPDREDMPPVVQEAINAGLARHTALEIWNQGFDFVDPDKRPDKTQDFETYLQEKIHLLKNSPSVENKGGWLLKAIKENYTNPKFAEQQQEKFRQERYEKIAELNREKEKIKKAYSNEKCEALFKEMIANHPQEVEEALSETASSQPLYGYDNKKRYAEQPMWVKVTVKPKLREKFPNAFKAVDEEYERQVSEIDQQIEELKEEATSVTSTQMDGR
jgi:hypothetical protein